MTIDPTPFLSAIVVASAAVVAIIGGLLVAKFVGLDTDQRASRKILTSARDRLGVARDRAQTAWRAILRWDAREFFHELEVVEAVVDNGVMSPAELTRMASWLHDPGELAPFVTEVTEEVARAREAIASRIRSDDVFWTDFRRRCRDLPEVRWPAVWRHVYDGIAKEHAEAEAAAAEARRRAVPPKSALEESIDRASKAVAAATQGSAFMTRVPLIEPPTDYRATAERRSDELLQSHARAQQQVEDMEAELHRLEQEHVEIVRPDARLWFGVAILIVLTVLGIVVPLGVMATGPRNLAQVRWVVYPFLASLALLIGYIVWYLAKLTEGRQAKSA